MIRVLMSVAVLLTSVSAFAGPNAAVFCHETEAPDSAVVFKAFDIALRDNVVLLEFEGQHSLLPESKREFTVKDVREFKSHLVERQNFSTSIAYTDKAQRRMQLITKAEDPAVVARVLSITYKTSVGDGTHSKRKGSVILKLQEGDVQELTYKYCYFEGALVDTWKKIWSAD